MFDRAPVPSGSLKRHFFFVLCKLFCLLFILIQEKHNFKLCMRLLFDYIYTARLLSFMQTKRFYVVSLRVSACVCVWGGLLTEACTCEKVGGNCETNAVKLIFMHMEG